jgi:hypothetical protein
MLLNEAAQTEETALPVSLVCPRPEGDREAVVPTANKVFYLSGLTYTT